MKTVKVVLVGIGDEGWGMQNDQKIIIIDPEVATADLCRSVLSNYGYTILCAESAEKGCELNGQHGFDLVITVDLLPGLDGIEAFEIMRESQPSIQGILVSANPSIAHLRRALNSGFSGFLTKPIVRSALVQRIEDIKRNSAVGVDHTRYKILIPLYEYGTDFLNATTQDEIFEILFNALEDDLGVPAATVMMPDEAQEIIRVVASRNMSIPLEDGFEVKSGDRISGWVYQKAEPVILNKRTQKDSPFSKRLEREEVTASISFPMIHEGKVIGVLNITNDRDEVEYTNADFEYLSVLCNFTVLALEKIKYQQEREQRLHMQTLMQQYVSEEVAELILTRKVNPLTIGELTHLTVIFADIRHYTRLVQAIPLRQTRQFLNEFFDIFVAQIYERKGTLDKFMGDAALAIFGAPVKIGNTNHNALQSACGIAEGFQVLKNRWLEKYKEFKEVELGIGISSGNMFIGNLGSDERLDYTVIGPEVNIAQRLAAMGVGNRILITEPVYKALPDTHGSLEAMQVRLRGIENEVTVYEVVV